MIEIVGLSEGEETGGLRSLNTLTEKKFQMSLNFHK